LKLAFSLLLLVMAVGVPSDHASTRTVCLQLPGASNGLRDSWEGLAIVVNPKNSIDNLRLGQLREIFFGEKRWWSRQRRIRPVKMPRSAAEQQVVLHVLYRMSAEDFDKSYFFEVYRGEFPNKLVILPTPRDVRRYVASTPGAIGYLRSSDVDASLKVVRINGLLPGDDGYPLRLRTRPPN
jgi:ABC-type phosphate transport system substrate-binding protein